MKAIGIILAGGNNKRMKELSYNRAIAAMPMVGTYRSIDFALSNMSNSRIQKVAVLTQYNTVSLNEHLNSSKWWDFGRKQGGLYVFTPTITAEIVTGIGVQPMPCIRTCISSKEAMNHTWFWLLAMEFISWIIIRFWSTTFRSVLISLLSARKCQRERI